MKTEQVRVLVIGAGPAGLATATRLAEFNRVSVTIVDQQELPGGQYFRLPSAAPGVGRSPRDIQARRVVNATLKSPSVQFLGGISVIGSDEKDVLGSNALTGELKRITADVVVLCTGAREHVRPFPGWTHPRVVTGGLLSHWIRGDGTAGLGAVLLAGSGPFLLSLAHECLANGIAVHSTLERSHPYTFRKLFGRHLLDLPRVGEGARFLTGLARGRAFPLQGSEISCVRTGSDGKIDVDYVGDYSGTASVDLVAVSDGFTPNTGLAALFGIEPLSDSEGVPHIPTDDGGRTSSNWIYAAGESCGVAGHNSATLRGRNVADSIAVDFGLLPHRPVSSKLRRKVRSAQQAYASLQQTYDIGHDAAAAEGSAETRVCRCEHVKHGELASVVDSGTVDRFSIRQETRIGMGICQGRECSRFLGDYLLARTGVAAPPARDRFPHEPISCSALMKALATDED